MNIEHLHCKIILACIPIAWAKQQYIKQKNVQQNLLNFKIFNTERTYIIYNITNQ